MPKRIIDFFKNLLRDLKKGVPKDQLMKKYGFKTSTQLKTAIANAAMAQGIIPELAGGRGGLQAKEVSRKVKVNSRGSLIIPKQLAEKYGLKVGDTFEVSKSAAGLSLKKV
ncbi:MAG: AbrB/MazE/SpoVT family DNA-binding domain-containing protein [Proteobacteria bacterium]|nr:AbrB/MazE/SpoVT family DNA-binding domain-containing protein [Pseudomonadota bacterium]